MKNLLHFTLSSLLLIFAANAAVAQESGSPSFENYDTEHLDDRDRILSTPGESVDPPRPTVKASRDSAVMKPQNRNGFKPVPAIPKDESKPKNQSDDSIVSFNFLYYLIQKYKMQDILE